MKTEKEKCIFSFSSKCAHTMEQQKKDSQEKLPAQSTGQPSRYKGKKRGSAIKTKVNERGEGHSALRIKQRKKLLRE